MKTEINQEEFVKALIYFKLMTSEKDADWKKYVDSWDVQDTERNDETEVYFYVNIANGTDGMCVVIENVAKLLGLSQEVLNVETDWKAKQTTIKAVVTIPDSHTRGVAGNFWACSERCGDDGELHVVTSFDTEDGARAWMRHKYEEYRAKNNLLPSDFTWQHGFKKDGCKRWTCYDNKSESPYGEWIVDEVEVGDGEAEEAKE